MENGMNYLWFQHQTNMQGGDGLYSRMSGNQMFRESVDPELDHKTRRVSDKFSENINTIANEPSLAFFRIQEHVRKTLPQLVEQKHEVQTIQQKVQGACFDTEYATNAVKTMYQSEFHFQNIQELLKNAMFMKQQIGYEESRRPGTSPSGSSPSLSTVSTSPASSTALPPASAATASVSSGTQHPPATSAASPESMGGPADVRAVGIVPAGSLGYQPVSRTLATVKSLNCDSDDIDVATEVDEESALS